MRRQTIWGQGDYTIGIESPDRNGKLVRCGERIRLETTVEYIDGKPVAYHAFGDVVGEDSGRSRVDVQRIVVEGLVMDCSYRPKSNEITLDIETDIPPEYRGKVVSALKRGRDVKVEFECDARSAFTE